jgi:hypothetical protein
MAKDANPTVSGVASSPSKVERRVMCAGYERCLDEALRRRWRGFSCRTCHAFQPLALDSSEWLLDWLACVALMGVAEFQGSFKQKRRGNIVVTLKRLHSQDPFLSLS